MDTAIAQQRLSNQRIDGERCRQPEDVVRWLGALQAQDYRQALWAIGLRTQSATVADVEQAITDRKILRTWPLRGTLHVVPAEDAKWMLELSAARLRHGDRQRLSQLELDESIIEGARRLLQDALTGGKRLTRPAAMRLLEDAGIRTSGQRGYHLLWHLAQAGLICLGPMEGKQQTFVLLDEWAPHARHYPREEALAVLAERYFASRGPATVYDYAHWSGLTITEAKAGLRGASSRLIADTFDGQEYWTGPDSPGRSSRLTASVFLLPGFDEYLLGYRDRSAVLAREHTPKVVPGANGIFMPMVVVGGRVVGVWKRSLTKTALDIVLAPFSPLGAATEGATAAAKRYCAFLGSPLASMTIAGG
jgi:hypothetical protein